MSSCIDWHSQWKLHAPNFRNGYAHVDLGLGRSILLSPGPGFGDLSHPTTKMMLDCLKHYPLHPSLIDIGSGSGILSLAAAALGVKKVYGIEIDPEAIDHARANAEKNRLEARFCLPQEFHYRPTAPVTIAMNMIRSEQKTAWKALPSLHKLTGDMFTSGVLEEEQEHYLKQTLDRGWTHVSTLSSDGWLAFHFKRM